MLNAHTTKERLVALAERTDASLMCDRSHVVADRSDHLAKMIRTCDGEAEAKALRLLHWS